MVSVKSPNPGFRTIVAIDIVVLLATFAPLLASAQPDTTTMTTTTTPEADPTTTSGAMIPTSTAAYLFGLDGMDDGQVNPCQSKPCGNGVCIVDRERNKTNRDYHCYCEDGYTGDHCEKDWDECWSNPCHNLGLCVDQVADYNCTCPQGYRGKQCEVNVDECVSNPCLNNGTCVDDINGYFCECIRGFTGQNCEVDVSVCNSTETKCSNGGQCIEGLGAAFFCYCQTGWTGVTCDENVDECANNPCENGGACLDIPGSYLCGCPMGFTGDRCQLALEQCDTNPCKNDALCFITGDSHECYCVPDYHGPNCEYRYNDCLLPPFPKCFNDGKCQDGVDAFSCSCPDGFSGNQCECNIDSGQCQNTNDSLTWTLPPNFEDLLLADRTTTTTTMVSLDSTTPSREGPSSDDDLLETPSFGTTDIEGTMVILDPSVVPTSMIVYNMTSGIDESPVTSLYIYEMSSEILVTKSFLADKNFVIRTSSPGGDEDTYYDSDLEGGIFSSPTFSFLGPTETIVPVTVVPEDSLKTITFNTTEDDGQLPDVTTFATPDATETTEDSSSEAAPSSTESQATTSVETLTEDPLMSSNTSGLQDESTTSAYSPEDQTSAAVDEEASNTEEPINFDDIGLGGVEESLGEGSCSSDVCQNGGTCLSTLTGPKCHCPLQYAGRQCEEEVDIEVTGFVGHSLLVHNLPKDAKGFDLLLNFQTSTPDGLLFYSGDKDQMLITGYIQEGVLKFKVSCGTQVILFADPMNRVDTGYQQSIHVELSINEEASMCSTVIKLNETHTMKGQQEIEVAPKQPETIYIGSTPHKTDPELALIHTGFQGCMHKFQMFGADIHLFKNAVSGRDVVECESAICTTQPCQNGAICTQHVESGSWFCNCPPGYTGTLCEKPVCEANPCRSGGTCLGSKAGPGFICLCPFGMGGVLCQEDVVVNQPAFTSSVGGYSSYVAYPAESTLSSNFEAQFHFSTLEVGQVALLFFIGQRGLHEFGSDYVAVSYVKGHVLLTWDMGSGPRRIFTRRPVDERFLVHRVYFGRNGRLGWLQVDNFPNITGKAPGTSEALNVTSKFMYLGGHENHNFSMLPHDLPVHRGFDGCIFDLAVRSSPGGSLVPVGVPDLENRGIGRNVHQCYIDVCASNPCSNGGTCIGYGASFVCDCPDGKFGVTCNEEASVCATGRNECSEGSKCSVLKDGSYKCLCPLGKTGDLCDQSTRISDPRFDGRMRSSMSRALDSAVRFNTDVKVDVKPEGVGGDGVLLHMGQSKDSSRHQDFFTLMLKNRSAVLTFSLGGPRGMLLNSMSLSVCCVAPDRWTTIEAGRAGREAYLRIDGEDQEEVVGTAPPGLTTLDVEPVLHLGGMKSPDSTSAALSDDYQTVLEAVDPHFSGCMSNLEVNGVKYPLATEAGWEGWAIEDCDGTACGAEVCHNGGVCRLDESAAEGFECECPEEFLGNRCEVHGLCHNNGGCQNGGVCSVVVKEDQKDDDQEDASGAAKCHCPLGFTGDKCELDSDLSQPAFDGDGFLAFTIPEENPITFVTSFSLDIKTEVTDGLIVWIGEDMSSDDYLGIGLRQSMIHLVWNLGWFSRSEMTIPSPSAVKINDGKWHSIRVERIRQSVDLDLDGEVYNSRVGGSYYELNTFRSILIGGVNGTSFNILDVTRGHFRSGFVGCVRNLMVQNQEVLSAENLQQSVVVGRNVGTCPLQDDYYDDPS